jgi:chemotaxis protein methyltransferase CheR
VICHTLSLAELAADGAYPALKRYVVGATGLAYYDDKDSDFADRVLKRLGAVGAPTCAAYLGILNDPVRGDAELDALVELLTIGETSFYRHLELFNGLRDRVIPDLIAKNRHLRRLRIWSAGCSVGAEAYSIAILLKREFGSSIDGWDVSIVGTDINRRFLARAREGSFRDWDFRGSPDWVMRDCFTGRGDERAIRPEYRGWVSFQYHNLIRHPIPSLVHNLGAFDLILCRNVIIYFNNAIMRRTVDQFHRSLVDGGWLLVGHSEPNIDVFRAFNTVNVPGAVLYQKAAGGPSLPYQPARPCAVPDVAPPAPPPSPPRPLPDLPPGPDLDARLDTVRRFADAGYLEEAASRCQRLIVNDRERPALHLYLAMLLEQMNRHDLAEGSLRRAIRLDRRCVLAHYVLAQVYQKQARHPEAAQSYADTLALLAGLDDAASIPEADDMTVADLRELTRMQMETLTTP